MAHCSHEETPEAYGSQMTMAPTTTMNPTAIAVTRLSRNGGFRRLENMSTTSKKRESTMATCLIQNRDSPENTDGEVSGASRISHEE